MSSDLGGRFGLGPIDQVSYVVADLEQTVRIRTGETGPDAL